jgi:branched-chain amino acid transport system ATP-binding protein
MPALLEVRGLEVLRGGVPVLHGIDLDVDAGQAVVVLGRNGAGKSTLLLTLAGLLPASGGTITLDGEDITALAPPDRVARGLILVPEGRGILPGLTVRENLEAGAYHRRLRGGALADEVERVTVPFTVLQERFAQRAGSLSGGEQQMLVLARALMARPRLLLLDEPSLGLAPTIVEEVYALLDRAHLDGLTVVVVEQYVHVALGLATRGTVLAGGRVVLEGDAAELAGSAALVDAYLAAADAATG